MTNPFENEQAEYLVLVNEEGQYSLWPAYLDVPLGWKATGPKGERKVCLEWIDQNWTDMRPLSLRRQMEEDIRRRELRRTCETEQLETNDEENR
jgi:MbtH protein